MNLETLALLTDQVYDEMKAEFDGTETEAILHEWSIIDEARNRLIAKATAHVATTQGKDTQRGASFRIGQGWPVRAHVSYINARGAPTGTIRKDSRNYS